MSDTSNEAPRIITREPVTTAVIRGTQPMDKLTEFYDRAYPAIGEALREQGLAAGDAFGMYGAMDEGMADLEVGFTTDGAVETAGDVVASELPGGQYATLTHVGAYQDLGATWERLGKWITDQGRSSGQTVFEVYRDDPSDTNPETLRTELYWSLA